MVSLLDIVWGLVLLSSWGIADFLASRASVRIGSVNTAFLVQLLGLALPAVALLIALLMGGGISVELGRTAVFALLTGGLLGLAYAIYYTGLASGSVSMVSSVASAWLVVTILVGALVFGESVTWEQAFLIGVIMAGVLTIGLRRQDIGAPNSGISYGLSAMVMLGLALALWSPLTNAAGPLLAVLTARAVGAFVTLAFMRIKGAPIIWPSGRAAVVVLLAAAMLDALGYVAYNIGIERASLVVIAPFGAAHPVGTIVLAFIVLRERPAKQQWLGILLTVAGVVALSGVAGV